MEMSMNIAEWDQVLEKDRDGLIVQADGGKLVSWWDS